MKIFLKITLATITLYGICNSIANLFPELVPAIVSKILIPTTSPIWVQIILPIIFTIGPAIGVLVTDLITFMVSLNVESLQLEIVYYKKLREKLCMDQDNCLLELISLNTTLSCIENFNLPPNPEHEMRYEKLENIYDEIKNKISQVDQEIEVFENKLQRKGFKSLFKRLFYLLNTQISPLTKPHSTPYA